MAQKFLVTEGFSAFRRGTFGNGGHNLYVSRRGVLQRIHQFDLTGNGYPDIVFCNSQNYHEQVPVAVYRDPLNRCQCVRLPADGALGGTVADLTGQGGADLIVANDYGGEALEINTFIYYGGPGGWSEQRMNRLPVPRCTSAAVGDFNRDGRTDLALLGNGKVKLFYQSDVGLELSLAVELDIRGEQLAADDLDGDGYADLIVRDRRGRVRAYWGGDDGIKADRFNDVVTGLPAETDDDTDAEATIPDYVMAAAPLVKVIYLNRRPHVFVARADAAWLVPAGSDRSFDDPLRFACARPFSVASGDIDGDGHPDLVFACHNDTGQPGRSWIYWGSDHGFQESNRTALATNAACDVDVGDLNGDGRDEIAVCQMHDQYMFTTHSRLYACGPNRELGRPVELETHDARRVFIHRHAGESAPNVVFINHYARNKHGDVPVSVYLGGPEGYGPNRVLKLPGYGAVEAIVADLNDDGRPDIILANCAENNPPGDPGSYVYIQGTRGFTDRPTSTLPTTRAHGVACADLNRDGYLELVFAGFDNSELLIFHGTEQGFDIERPERIQLTYEGKTYKNPRWIYLADLDNDGYLDLVIPLIEDARSLILWGGPEGFSTERCQALTVWRGSCATAVDLTGNGYLDLIIGAATRSDTGPHDSFVYVYWNGPEGLHESRRTLLPANHVNALTVADFNNDGRLDLYVGNYSDNRVRDMDSFIYWNRPDHFFRAADRTRLFTHSASGCLALDFDDDGYMDLAVANHKVWGDHSGYSEIWWNGPDGFDPKRTTRLPTTGPHGMRQVDPGSILDRGPEEYYDSEPMKLPKGAILNGINWEADTPRHTWVRAQVRCADTRADLNDAAWQGPGGADTWYDSGQALERSTSTGRWLQYRLGLGAARGLGTPRVTSVRVGYAVNP